MRKFNKCYVVTKASPLSSIRQCGLPVEMTDDPNQPVAFMPVFTNYRKALKWARGDRSMVMTFTTIKE